jgi:hypothetical protein
MVLLRLLAGMLSILGTQLLLAAALMGIGLAVRRRFGLRTIRIDDCFLAFWVGLAGVILFLLLWNFFLPVGGMALPIVLAAGAWGLWISRHEIGAVFAAEGWRPSPGVVALLAVTGLWIANLCLGPLDNGDSALYHIQAVLWAEHYPAIPGLANLDGPIAFNNSSLLFDALLSAGPWQGRSNHLANGLLILVVLFQSIVAGARLAAGDRHPARLFGALLFAPAASTALLGRVSSFVTDTPTSLTLLVALTLLYSWLCADAHDDQEDAYSLVAFAILLALAVSFKLNAAVFAVSTFLMVCAIWWRRPIPAGLRRRTLSWAVGLVSLIALAWMGRGVVQSGYPLFPSPVGGFPVEWRAPAEHARAEFDFIVHSGRASTRNLPVVSGERGIGGWLPYWLTRAGDDPYHIVVPLALLLVAGIAGFGVLGRTPLSARPAIGRAWWIGLPVLAALVAWFFTSPEPRYALPYFWGGAALLVCQVYRSALASGWTPNRRRMLIACALLGISPLMLGPLLQSRWRHRGESRLRAILRNSLNHPGTDLWFQPIPVKPSVKPYRTRSGLQLNAVENLCWDAPLPCTPNPAPNLRLRDPANLARGFVVDGPWQMENWPTARQSDFLAAWRRSKAGARLYRERVRPPHPDREAAFLRNLGGERARGVAINNPRRTRVSRSPRADHADSLTRQF